MARVGKARAVEADVAGLRFHGTDTAVHVQILRDNREMNKANYNTIIYTKYF